MFFKKGRNVSYEMKRLNVVHVSEGYVPWETTKKAKRMHIAMRVNEGLCRMFLEHYSKYGYEIKASVLHSEVIDDRNIPIATEVVTLQRPSSHSLFGLGIPQLDDDLVEDNMCEKAVDMSYQ